QRKKLFLRQRAQVCIEAQIAPDVYDSLSPEETAIWIDAIQDKRKREDQLIARLGYFLYTSQGAKKKGGGHWKENDFLPKKPPSEKQLAIIAEVEAMKIAAMQKRKQNGNT